MICPTCGYKDYDGVLCIRCGFMEHGGKDDSVSVC